MTRVVYFVIVLVALVPSAMIAAGSLYVLAHHRLTGPASLPARDYTSHYYTVGIAGVEMAIYPRRWPAVLVLVGALLWCIGIVFLLFVRGF
jgi:hypothetical protein